jgi:hypothetical protein
LWAEIVVVEGNGFAVGDVETPGEFTIRDVGFIQMAASSGVDGFVIVGGVRSAGGGLNIFAGADAGID